MYQVLTFQRPTARMANESHSQRRNYLQPCELSYSVSEEAGFLCMEKSEGPLAWVS
jgi:hypothetical protein